MNTWIFVQLAVTWAAFWRVLRRRKRERRA